MSNYIETIRHRGHDIKVYQDDCIFETPNDWCTEEVCVCYDHRDFTVAPILGGYKLDAGWCQTLFNHWYAGNKTTTFGNTKYWIFPVYLFSHGGQSLYLSRAEANQWEPTGFDTSFKGFCLVEKKNPRHWSMEDARKTAKQHLESWNEYLSGDVYGYMCESTDDSCWGYWGKTGYEQMIKDAKANINHMIKFKREERVKICG